MAGSSPTIRPATSDDRAFIAGNILASQRGHRPRGWFDIALGWPEPRCLDFVERITCAETVSWWHVSQFIIAEVDGQPAAALCALPAAGTIIAAQKAFAEVTRTAALGAAELAGIAERRSYTANCWVQGSEDDWLIEHVATLPPYRGRGLVQALLDRALAAGRAAGYRRVWIPFLIGNEAAERTYAKAGFVVAEDKRDPAFETLTGAPGFRRMVRAI